MVMRPDPRTGALTTVRRRHWGPWWLWTIVVVLAASAAYAGYWVRSANEQLAHAEAARQILAANSENIQADRVALQGSSIRPRRTRRSRARKHVPRPPWSRSCTKM